MARLVERKVLSAKRAIEVAAAIHASNPLHIPQVLVERFADKVYEIEANCGAGS